MTDEANVAGTAYVKVEVETSELATSMQNAVNTALEKIQAELNTKGLTINVNTTQGGGAAAPASGGRGRVKASDEGVDANVPAAKGISDSIQKALNTSSGAGFALPIDTSKLREQVQLALNQPFILKVKLEAEGGVTVPSGAQVSTGGAPAAAAQSSSFNTPATVIGELDKTLSKVKNLGGDIQTFYEVVQEMVREKGGTFGRSEGNAGGNVQSKLEDLIGLFGGDLTSWAQAGRGKITGGGTVSNVLGGMGFGQEDISGLDSILLPLIRGSASGAGGVATLNSLAGQIAQGVSHAITQAASQPTPTVTVQNPTAVRATQAEAAGVPLPAESRAALAARQERAVTGANFLDASSIFARFAAPPTSESAKGEEARALAEEQRKLRATLARPRLTDEARSSAQQRLAEVTAQLNSGNIFRPDVDPAATGTYRSQVGRGGFRETDRELINYGELVGKTPGGIGVDLRPLVEFVSRAGAIVQEVKTGRLLELGADTKGLTEGEMLGLESATNALGSRRKPFTLPNVKGVQGQVRPLSSVEAVSLLAQNQFGGEDAPSREEVGEFVNQPSIRNVISKAADAGRTRTAGDAGRGSGNFIPGQNPEAYVRAGFALERLDKEIGETAEKISSYNDRIEEREATGKPADRLYDLLAQQEAKMDRLVLAREETAERAGRTRSITPDEARAAAANDVALGAQSREIVEKGLHSAIYEALGTSIPGGLLPGAEGIQQRRTIGKGLLGEENISRDDLKVALAQLFQPALDAYKDPNFKFRQVEDTRQPAITDRNKLVADLQEATGRGADEDVVRLHQDRLAAFDRDAQAGRLSRTYPLTSESRAAAFNRTFEETAGPLRELLPEKGPVRGEALSVIDDVKRGFRDYIRNNNDFAQESVDRAQTATAGRGRVVETNGANRSAGSLALDRFTTSAERRRVALDDLLRQGQFPVTSLDTGLQDVESEAYKQLTAAKIGGGDRSRLTAAETKFSETTPSKSHENLLALRALEDQAREISAPVSAARAEARQTRESAVGLIGGLTGGASSLEELRAALAVSTSSGAERQEAEELLKYNQPGSTTISLGNQLYPSPKTRAAREPSTGTEDAQRFAAAGGQAPGYEKPAEGPAWTDAVSALRAAYAEQGGGAGGGRGRGTAVGGPGGFSGGGGQIHVIVDNPMPWRVTLDGGTGGGGGGGGSPAEEAVSDARRRFNSFSGLTGDAARRRAQTSIDRLRGQGFDDQAILRAMRQEGLGSVGELLLGGQGAGGAGGLNSVRRRLGLSPFLADRTGPEAQAADQQRASLTAEANQAQRVILSRGFQASVTDLIQSQFPQFEAQRTAVARFQRESSQLGSLLDKQADATARNRAAEDTLVAARANGTKTIITAAEKEVARTQSIKAQTDVQVEAQKGLVSQARQDLPGRGNIAGNLAIGSFAGGAATALATVVFQVTSQVLAVAEQEVGKVLAGLADELSGFANTAAAVGNTLGQATRAAGGNAQVAVAGALAGTGIGTATAGAITPDLEKRATIIAGNQALQEQADFIRAARSFGSGTTEQGLFQPSGGIPGLTRSTGGFLGTPLGGQPSTLEGLAKQLPGSDTTDFFATQFPFLSTIGSILDRDVLGQQGQFNRLVPDQQTADQFTATIKDWNDALAKSDTTVRAFTGATEEQQKQTEEILASGGAPGTIIQRFKDLGIGFSGTQGLSNRDVVTQFLSGVGANAGAPNADELFRANQRGLGIQVSQIEAQSANQLQFNSAQAALSNLASPPRTLEQAFGFGPNGPGPGVPDSVIASYDKLKSTADSAFAGLQKDTDAGIQQLKALGLSDQDITKIKDLGETIRDLQTTTAAQQTQNNYLDFAHNLEIGKRTLSDIVGLNDRVSVQVQGIGEVQASNLGVEERIVLEKSRELTILNQELSQRQIDFRKAVAGFQAEGLTPEEIAARQDQAVYEANIAQKQLNLQKGITGAQFKIVDEQNLRQLNDTIYSLEKLQRDFSLQVKVQGESAIIDALSRTRDKIVNDSNVTLNKFRSIQELSVSTAATIAQQTDESFTDLLKKSQRTIAQIKSDYLSIFGPTDQSQSQGGGQGPGRGKDTGGPGNPTRTFTGGATINGSLVSFGNVTVHSLGDIDAIAQKVEQALDRKGALLGLVAPVGSG